MDRSSAPFADMLRCRGLRPTRQRLALARLLFDGRHRHVTAEQLHGEARRAGLGVALATVYNTLHQFTASGLLRQVMVEPGRAHFDTNTRHHHHFYFEESGRLEDLDPGSVTIGALPPPPAGAAISRVDVVVRVRRADG